MTLNQAFAVRVREILGKKNMSQSSLERDICMQHSTMNSILNGITKASNFKNLALIINGLGISITEFFDSPVFNFDNLEIE